jgi:predicted nuclease with TOPRIM domain
MEVISAITTIGTLLQQIQVVVEYINDVKDANEDRNKLDEEIQATKVVLKQLESHANEDEWKETMEALSAPGGVFEGLKQELDSMANKLKPPNKKWKRGAKSLIWNFTKDGIRNHFDRIERLKGLLMIALQNNQAYNSYIICTD